MFWPMRSQRQLPHQVPRAVPRLPLMPPAQGQNVFSSTVFCLYTQRLLNEGSVHVLGRRPSIAPNIPQIRLQQAPAMGTRMLRQGFGVHQS